MPGFTEWTDENDAEMVRRVMKGPEPKLSPADQAALDKLKCDVCQLPGMKDGRCVLCIRCEGCDRQIERGGYIHSGMCRTCAAAHYD